MSNFWWLFLTWIVVAFVGSLLLIAWKFLARSAPKPGVTVTLRWSTEEAGFWIPEPEKVSAPYIVVRGGLIEEVYAAWNGEIVKGWSDTNTVAPGDTITVELNNLMRPIVHVQKPKAKDPS